MKWTPARFPSKSIRPSDGSPVTVNNSASGSFWLPWKTSSRSISATRLSRQPVGDHALDLDGDARFSRGNSRSATSGARSIPSTGSRSRWLRRLELPHPALDSLQDRFVAGKWRIKGRTQRNRHIVHAIDGTRGVDPVSRRVENDRGAAGGGRVLGVQYDRRGCAPGARGPPG